ncbi:MAG: hypothetical protein HY807_06280 [Nitrospirae bacterium]|nr:hypothetical protein [Nitrospirota bacterium]
MKKSRFLLVVIIVVTALSFAGGAEKASAGGHWATRTVESRGGGRYGSFITVSVFVHTQSPVMPITLAHHIAPPGFPYEWFAKDAADSFRKNGLKVNTASAVKDEHPKAKECMKIHVTSNDKNLEGCILTFEKKEDLEAQQKHYLALNEKGELHNWSFVKDNVLLVLDGSVSEEEARLYESSLGAMAADK